MFFGKKATLKGTVKVCPSHDVSLILGLRIYMQQKQGRKKQFHFTVTNKLIFIMVVLFRISRREGGKGERTGEIPLGK